MTLGLFLSVVTQYYIPVIIPCVFRLHAWGDTLEEAFEQCAMAMFGYMTDTATVEPVDTVEVQAEGEGCSSSVQAYEREKCTKNLNLYT